MALTILILRILGILDIIAGFLIILAHPIGTWYLIFKGFIFILSSKGTCILSWADFLFGILALFFFSQYIAFIIFFYLIVKGVFSLI
ncbi:MAG TPA: hypothetical protein EYH56_03465 [Nanoarchaeota archaeon]|nr:hypothetical protein [Nanoarchaeota archaeon]